MACLAQVFYKCFTRLRQPALLVYANFDLYSGNLFSLAGTTVSSLACAKYKVGIREQSPDSRSSLAILRMYDPEVAGLVDRRRYGSVHCRGEGRQSRRQGACISSNITRTFKEIATHSRTDLPYTHHSLLFCGYLLCSAGCTHCRWWCTPCLVRRCCFNPSKVHLFTSPGPIVQ